MCVRARVYPPLFGWQSTLIAVNACVFDAPARLRGHTWRHRRKVAQELASTPPLPAPCPPSRSPLEPFNVTSKGVQESVPSLLGLHREVAGRKNGAPMVASPYDSVPPNEQYLYVCENMKNLEAQQDDSLSMPSCRARRRFDPARERRSPRCSNPHPWTPLFGPAPTLPVSWS